GRPRGRSGPGWRGGRGEPPSPPAEAGRSAGPGTAWGGPCARAARSGFPSRQRSPPGRGSCRSDLAPGGELSQDLQEVLEDAGGRPPDGVSAHLVEVHVALGSPEE